MPKSIVPEESRLDDAEQVKPPETQEAVDADLERLGGYLEESVLEKYRIVTGENPQTIEETTQDGMDKTMGAWGNYFEGLFSGSPNQIRDAMRKYEALGFDVHAADARLQFILGKRNRRSEADKKSEESI